MRYKAVFVDIDNTLLSFDGYVKQTMAEGFAHFGLPAYTPDMYDVFTRENDSLWQRLEQGALDFQTLQQMRWNSVFRALGISFDGPTFERYFRGALHESAIPEPGAYALLERLYGNTILCVASNGPLEQQLHRLALADMARYFSFCFISEDIGAAKPARAFFETAFSRLNAGRALPILPSETLMLGDRLSSDIAGGREYGMHTCYYKRGSGMPAAGEAEFVVDTLPELVSLFSV